MEERVKNRSFSGYELQKNNGKAAEGEGVAKRQYSKENSQVCEQNEERFDIFSYAQPFVRDFAVFAKGLSSERCMRLMRDGYVVLDDCLEPAYALALHHEIKWLSDKGYMKGNKTQFNSGEGKAVQYIKPNIFEVIEGKWDVFLNQD